MFRKLTRYIENVIHKPVLDHREMAQALANVDHWMGNTFSLHRDLKTERIRSELFKEQIKRLYDENDRIKRELNMFYAKELAHNECSDWSKF